MQDDLNKLMVGEIFDSTDHAAQLLTLLFFAMAYAPGLPLLMPLGCFAFVLYFRIDKFLICRYYRKPLNIGPAVIKEVLFYLPFAALIRLGFGAWMYSNPDILPVGAVKSQNEQYMAFLENQKAAWGGETTANNRLFQFNTFPLFFYFLFILFLIFVKTFWNYLPFKWIWRLIEKLFFVCCSKRKKNGKGDIYADHREDLDYAKAAAELRKIKREEREQRKVEAEASSKKNRNSRRGALSDLETSDIESQYSSKSRKLRGMEPSTASSPKSRRGSGLEEPEVEMSELDRKLSTTPSSKRRKRGTITLWDLKKSGDTFRQQTSPFTDDYYRLIKHKDYIPETCYEMLIYNKLDKLSELEIEEGFKISEKDDFVVHIKIWKEDRRRKIDGSVSRFAQVKKTYEVISDHRLYSYNIERVTEYALAIQGLRAGITSVVEHIRVNHQDSISNGGGTEVNQLLFEKAGLTSHFADDYQKKKNKKNGIASKKSFADTVAENLGTLIVSFVKNTRRKGQNVGVEQSDPLKTNETEQQQLPPVDCEESSKALLSADLTPNSNKIVPISDAVGLGTESRPGTAGGRTSMSKRKRSVEFAEFPLAIEQTTVGNIVAEGNNNSQVPSNNNQADMFNAQETKEGTDLDHSNSIKNEITSEENGSNRQKRRKLRNTFPSGDDSKELKKKKKKKKPAMNEHEQSENDPFLSPHPSEYDHSHYSYDNNNNNNNDYSWTYGESSFFSDPGAAESHDPNYYNYQNDYYHSSPPPSSPEQYFHFNNPNNMENSYYSSADEYYNNGYSQLPMRTPSAGPHQGHPDEVEYASSVYDPNHSSFYTSFYPSEDDEQLMPLPLYQQDQTGDYHWNQENSLYSSSYHPEDSQQLWVDNPQSQLDSFYENSVDLIATPDNSNQRPSSGSANRKKRKKKKNPEETDGNVSGPLMKRKKKKRVKEGDEQFENNKEAIMIPSNSLIVDGLQFFPTH
jgi:hypothetical protein